MHEQVLNLRWSVDVELVALLIKHVEHHATAARHAGQGVVGNDHRQAGFFADEFVQVAQQCAATGEHNAAFGNVGTQLRRSALKGLLDGLDDAEVPA